MNVDEHETNKFRIKNRNNLFILTVIKLIAYKKGCRMMDGKMILKDVAKIILAYIIPRKLTMCSGAKLTKI